MRRWVTHIEAIDYKDRGLKLWVGPYIEAPTKKLAQEYCDNNGLGYCRVIAEEKTTASKSFR
jgi:hypothetical protein